MTAPDPTAGERACRYRALQAAVEALADEWASKPDDRCYDGDRARALRALLAGGEER